MTQATSTPPKRIISNAYRNTTRLGKQVFRIRVNTAELLSYLEEGKTMIAFDILTNNGLPRIANGNKNNRSWTAIQYYTWALAPKELEVK